MVGFMVGFVVGLLVGCLVGFLVGCLVGFLVEVGAGASPSRVESGIKPSLLKELATFTVTSLSYVEAEVVGTLMSISASTVKRRRPTELTVAVQPVMLCLAQAATTISSAQV